MKSSLITQLSGVLVVVGALSCGGRGGGGGTGPSSKPVVTAGSHISLPVGTTYSLSATFTDTTNSAPWSYEVAWGDGQNMTGTKNSVSPITGTHTYASEGDYTVTVSVTNQQGESGDASVTVSATPPVLLTAGDIGDCFPTRHGDDSTGFLLDSLDGVVVPLGDNAYDNGTLDEYNNCYGPNWGRQKYRTRPVAGNHDYNTPGAPGYFGYFGAAAGDPAKGYYDYTLGSWLVLAINTGTDKPSNYAAGSPQEQWLRAELASHNQQCVLAVLHHPRFSTIDGRAPIQPPIEAIWKALYEYGADLVVNGHDHSYQRFAPMKPDGTRDNAFGIRQITVGTGGGETLYQFSDTLPPGFNIEVRNNTTHGILKLTLRANGYDWKFVPASGATFTDSGSGNCHGRPS